MRVFLMGALIACLAGAIVTFRRGLQTTEEIRALALAYWSVLVRGVEALVTSSISGSAQWQAMRPVWTEYGDVSVVTLLFLLAIGIGLMSLDRFMSAPIEERGAKKEKVSSRHSQAVSSPGTKPMKFLSGSTILKQKAVSMYWVVEGYLCPKFVTLLSAPPKCGKSEILFGMLKDLLSDRPFCGLATRFSRVLVLSEEAEETIRPKLEGLGPLARFVTVVPKHLSGDKDWKDKWADAVRYARKKGAMLVVIDPMAEWLGLPPGGENTPGLVVEALNVIRESARNEKLAVLVIHHSRKEGGTFGTGVRGSNGITGAVDVILELTRVDGGLPTERKVTALSRFRETPSELTVKWTPEGYVKTGDGAATTGDGLATAPPALTDAESALLRALGSGPLATPALIASSGVSKAQVSRLLPGLVERGLLAKSGSAKKGDPAVYALPSVHLPAEAALPHGEAAPEALGHGSEAEDLGVGGVGGAESTPGARAAGALVTPGVDAVGAMQLVRWHTLPL